MKTNWVVSDMSSEPRYTCNGCWYKCSINSIIKPNMCLVQETRFLAKEMRAGGHEFEKMCSILTYTKRGKLYVH
jgi:hypothetical protein